MADDDVEHIIEKLILPKAVGEAMGLPVATVYTGPRQLADHVLIRCDGCGTEAQVPRTSVPPDRLSPDGTWAKGVCPTCIRAFVAERARRGHA